MRKHFLILMLLTLLPLAGWAQTIDLELDGALSLSSRETVFTGQTPADITFTVYETTGINPILVNDSHYDIKFYTTLGGDEEVNFATTNAGTTIYAAAVAKTGDGMYVNATPRQWFKIMKAEPNVNAPTPKTGLVYDGEAKQLIETAGSVTTGGSMQYSVDNTDWYGDITANELKKTDANIAGHTVYWKVEATTNYNEAEGFISVPIAKATTAEVTAPVLFGANDNAAHDALTYNGENQQIIKTAAVKTVGDGALKYSIDNENWYDAIDANGLKVKDVANSLTVYYKMDEGSNYAATEVASVSAKAILPASIENATVTVNGTYTFTGFPYTPDVTVTVAGVTGDLAATDYEITDLLDNTAAGTAKFKVTGAGNFEGVTPEKTFKINKKSIASGLGWANVIAAMNAADKTYTGTGVEIPGMLAGNVAAEDEVAPTLTTAAGVYTLQKGVDYTISYTNNVDAGVNTAKAVFTGIGSFQYVNNREFTISPRPLTVTVEEKTASIGADFQPTVTVANFANATDEAAFDTNGSIIYAYSQGGVAKNPATDGEGVYDVDVTLTWANTNYDVAGAAGHAVLTINKGQVVLKIKTQEITYGEDPDVFHFEHVRGLSEAQATQAWLDANVGTIALNQTTYNATNMKNANIDGYDVEYTGNIVNTDYTFTVNPGKLVINRKDLRNGANMTSEAANIVYNGENATTTVTIKDNGVAIPASEYTVSYGSNYNVGTGRKATISANDGGNYCVKEWAQYPGTENEIVRNDYDVTYNITRAPLTITADDFLELTYGTVKDDYVADVAGLVGATDQAKHLMEGHAAGFIGTLKVKNVSNGNVGEHTGALVPYFVKDDGTEVALDLTTADNNDAASDNYTITAVAGKLNVIPAEITVKVAPATLGYGVAPTSGALVAADNTFRLVYVSGLPAEEEAKFDELVDYSTNPADYGYNAVEMADINETTGYDLLYSGTATATNYTIKFENNSKAGKLLVTKRPVRFVVKDGLTISYDQLTTFQTAISDLAALEDAGTLNTYIDQTVGALDGKTYYDLLGGHKWSDLIASMTLETAQIGDNALTLEAKSSEDDIAKNYQITLVGGNLTITKDASVTLMTLARIGSADFNTDKNTAAETIHANNGKIRDVQITFPGQTMYGNKWYAMVLPFATSVKQISEAFGYAIVDIFNVNSNDPNDVSFKVHMGDIEANQPFIVKIYKDIKADDANVTYPGLLTGVLFENVEIAESNNTTLTDGYGNQFIGLYSGKLGGFNVEYDWTYGLGKDATTYQPIDNANFFIRPLGAYVHFKDPQEHNARTITIEELGGETTVIQINSDATDDAKGWYNMNGVKMNAAPAQKGVYIHNGKKVVIK